MGEENKHQQRLHRVESWSDIGRQSRQYVWDRKLDKPFAAPKQWCKCGPWTWTWLWMTHIACRTWKIRARTAPRIYSWSFSRLSRTCRNRRREASTRCSTAMMCRCLCRLCLDRCFCPGQQTPDTGFGSHFGWISTY